jgi:hypothetical protein
MRLSTRESWGQFCAGALFALLAAGLAAPNASQAGCAHYVVVKGAPHPGLSGLEMLGAEGLLPLGNGEGRAPAVPTPADRPAPCTGVLCSGAPATPVMPAPPSTTRADQWGLLAASIPDVSDEPAYERPADSRLRPVLGGSGVFHPPRASRPFPFV